MHIELINTGQELLLGRVLNTHQQWICRQLADLGYEVNRQICVADDGPSIQAAVRESLGRSDLVITTGGLGPTSDDITRDLIARLLERELTLDVSILAHIEQYFLRRKIVMTPSTKVQAMVPKGAIVLHNANGTAPGLAIEVKPNPFRSSGERSWLVLLPGPPRELRPMFTNSVVPLLLKEFPANAKFVSRTLKTTGLGESLVEERIAGPLKPLVERGLEIGYCGSESEKSKSVWRRGGGGMRRKLVAEGETIVRGLLRSLIFAVDDGTLEQTVVQTLAEQNKTAYGCWRNPAQADLSRID